MTTMERNYEVMENLKIGEVAIFLRHMSRYEGVRFVWRDENGHLRSDYIYSNKAFEVGKRIRKSCFDRKSTKDTTLIKMEKYDRTSGVTLTLIGVLK